MKHTIATVELEDGRTLKARVGIATKMQWEKSAKAQGWNADDNPFTVNLFWAWHATRHAGQHDLSWESFVAAAVDADLDVVEAPAGEADPDPTQTAATTA